MKSPISKALAFLVPAFLLSTTFAHQKTYEEMVTKCSAPIDLIIKLDERGPNNRPLFSIWDIPVALNVLNLDENFRIDKTYPVAEGIKMDIAQKMISLKRYLYLPTIFKDIYSRPKQIRAISWEIADCDADSIVFTTVPPKRSADDQTKSYITDLITVKVKIVKNFKDSGELEILEKLENYQFIGSPHYHSYGSKSHPVFAEIRRKLIWSKTPKNSIELQENTLDLLSIVERAGHFDNAIIERLNMLPAGSCIKLNGNENAECRPLQEVFDFRVH